jgi:hypothetical protein
VGLVLGLDKFGVDTDCLRVCSGVMTKRLHLVI